MRERRNIPPKIAQRLLLRFLREDYAEEVLGDLDEKFLSVCQKQSNLRAKLNYWKQVIHYVRPFAFKRSKYSKHSFMLGHYIKISWRSILRHKALSTIKIGGFAVGIAACLLIALYVGNELSYDSHYQDQDQIFRITNQWTEGGEVGRWSNLQGPLKEVIEENIPEVEQVAKTVFWSWGNAGTNLVRTESSQLNIEEGGFIYADPELLDILQVKMVYGVRSQALTAPNSLVISRSIADKYFPNVDPVGKQIILNDKTDEAYTVGGVMADFPDNSHIQPDFIMTLAERQSGPGTGGWCCTNYIFYTKIKAGADKQRVEQKLLDVRDSYVMGQLKTAGKTGLEEMELHHSYYLQPIADAYINTAEVSDDITHGSMELVWIFGAIAMVILLLACVNFINLTTAKSLQRAKEVGLRKVVGSVRSDLIGQYLSESVVFSMLAILLALIIAYVALPGFNQLANKSLIMPWFSSWFLPSLCAVGVLIGVISGIYPAFYLSKFRPVEVLKGKISAGRGTAHVRGAMVVFQFMVTIVLLIGAIVTHQQFQLIMNKSLGYDKDQVITIHGLNTLDSANKASLKQEVLNLPSVQGATVSDFRPVAGTAIHNRTYWLASARLIDDGFEAARWSVDEDYLDTYGMRLVAGKNFSGAASDQEALIINETMAGMLGLQEAVGVQVIDMFDQKYRVIGIVQDFHFETLFAEVEPLAMVYGSGKSVLSVNISSEDVANTLSSIEAVWNDFKPNQQFRYAFLNQSFQKMYESFIRAKSIFLVFAVLSIIIACLGLFALSAYMVEQRSKEVSIRKVLGASVAGIFTLLSFDFIKLVLIALLLAIPLGWFLMDVFLGDIHNRVDLSWYLFAFAGVVGVLVAMITISFETIKAALVNPAKRLRSE